MAKLPTIIDVARLAGVSKATAARVVTGQVELVREETRQRVLEAVRTLGYERNAVAGSLRTRQTFMVALCIPDITNPFWPEVARGVQDTIETSGYATVTVNSDWNTEREEQYLLMVRRNRFDGLIINPTQTDNERLHQLGIPAVILGSGQAFPDFDSVGSDSEAAILEALDHLLLHGHRRIALIAGRSRRRKEFSRYGTYQQFHQTRGLPLDPALLIECDFSDQGGHEAMTRLAALPSRPSAVLAANDILALGAIKAAQALGLSVPGEVSIIGMDDIYAASMSSPALTTIAKPKYEIGATAARLLVRRLNREHFPVTHLRLPCQFVQRASTGVAGSGGGTTHARKRSLY